MEIRQIIDVPHVIIMGASLDTGNLGVSALLSSLVKGVRLYDTTIQIKTFYGLRNPVPQQLKVDGNKSISIERIGIRINKNVWKHNHLVHLFLTATAIRLLPQRIRNKTMMKNPILREIKTAKAVLDITGGDSFSDIYGLRNFFIDFLSKTLVLLCGTKYILMPQTFGPYKRKISQSLARFILKHADRVISRDEDSIRVVNQILGRNLNHQLVTFCPDVAFILDRIAPNDGSVQVIQSLKEKYGEIIGINVSGLLYNGGYTQNNMFGLKENYAKLIHRICIYFLETYDFALAFFPHVVPENFGIEDDLAACLMVTKGLPDQFKERIFITKNIDQFETKYCIGLCDFFIGSRMHSTIAAMSQYIPAVGIAYSKKFIGVFQSINIGENVIDLRTVNEGEVISGIDQLYQIRNLTQRKLEESIPKIISKVNSIFTTIW